MTAATTMSSSSLLLPVAAGAAAIGGIAYMRSRQHARRAGALPANTNALVTAPIASPPGRWVWPLPRWQGRAPVISDGYGSSRPTEKRGRRHRGVDIMYRRRSLGDLVDVFPPRAPHSLWHVMPPGTLVMAAADGEVWSAGETGKGWSVVISHGAPWATYYTHMTTLFVEPAKRGSSRQRVRAGEPLGIVGADPNDAAAIAHLHFEIWRGGNGTAAIDPKPLLASFAVLEQPRMAA